MKNKQLNKEDFIKAMKTRSGIAQYVLEEFLDVFTDTVMQEVANGNKVNIQGFGSFEAVERAARQSKNFSGEATIIEARKSPKFVVGAEFKRRVNE